MRVGIVGSRAFPNPEPTIAALLARWSESGDITVVSGGAPGVDSIAIAAAEQRGYATEVLPADWAMLGRQAGIVRNIQLVSKVDSVLALWDGSSPGTRNTIEQALIQRKHLEVVFP